MLTIEQKFNSISKTLENTLRKNIQIRVYNNYTPVKQDDDGMYAEYKRTYGLLDSVTVEVNKSSSGLSVNAYFDKDELSTYVFGRWSRHSAYNHYFNVGDWNGVEKGTFMYVPYFVNEGYHYSFAHVEAKRQHPEFMEKTMREMAVYVRLEFQDYIKSLFGLKLFKG